MKFVSGLLLLLIFVSSFARLPAGVAHNPLSNGTTVVRLSYRGSREKPETSLKDALTKPHSVGVFQCESFEQFPNFVGTDWQGSIYIKDPLTSESCLLKRFDRHGRFVEAWGPIQAESIRQVGVTMTGEVWATVSQYEQFEGFPVIRLERESREMKADWRAKLPDQILAAVERTLGQTRGTWGTDWFASIEAGKDKVSILLYSTYLGNKQGIGRFLRLLMDAHGTRVLDTELGWGRTPRLFSDDSQWFTETDIGPQPWPWSKVWVWKRGEERPEPLIDRTKKREPWPNELLLGNAWPPGVRIDAKGNIYLLWTLEQLELRTRIVVDGKVFSDQLPPPLGQGMRAVLVLDKNRKLISYLPWTPVFIAYGDAWLKPLPDGSGFYRIQFQEKEAVVYFHSLPK